MHEVKRGEKCPHCLNYNSRNIVVDGLVVFNYKLLLVKRGNEPEKGKWALVGGYLNWDETLEDAIIREVLEETGVEARVDYQLGIYSSPKRKNVANQNVAVVFALIANNENLIPQEGEVEEANWFDFTSIPENLAFDHREMIFDYLRKEEKND